MEAASPECSLIRRLIILSDSSVCDGRFVAVVAVLARAAVVRVVAVFAVVAVLATVHPMTATTEINVSAVNMDVKTIGEIEREIFPGISRRS